MISPEDLLEAGRALSTLAQPRLRMRRFESTGLLVFHLDALDDEVLVAGTLQLVEEHDLTQFARSVNLKLCFS